MTYLLLADIHGNNAALRAVLGASSAFDEILVAGDFVGYGPRPNECVEIIQNYKFQAVKGNHDAAVVEDIDLSWFNFHARKAIGITKDLLSEENLSFLTNLPKKATINNRLTLLHGSPRKPLTEYIKDEHSVRRNLEYLDIPVTLVGHTHVPAVYEISGGKVKLLRRKTVNLNSDSNYVINPGSVGQPRDGDPRASYALLDLATNKLKLRRISYNIESVQQEMQDLGFPNFLRRRLSRGI